MEPELAVIIPTYNEAQVLPHLLHDLAIQEDIALQIIVSDGGSSDDTISVASSFAAKSVVTTRGRGVQMNHGAASADADVLLFLHADSSIDDTHLLSSAMRAWRFERDPNVAGHFALDFGRSSRRYGFLARKTALNRPHSTHGDQGLWISRKFFEILGGFDTSMGFLEDQRIARKIRDRGRWITLPGTLRTSTRRFDRDGFATRYMAMALMMGAFEADLPRFFDHARDLYASHSDGECLDPAMLFEAVDATFDELAPAEELAAWLALGRFTRENIWQLALLADEVTGSEGNVFERFEALEPLLDNAGIDTIAAAIVWFTVRGVLPAIVKGV